MADDDESVLLKTATAVVITAELESFCQRWFKVAGVAL